MRNVRFGKPCARLALAGLALGYVWGDAKAQSVAVVSNGNIVIASPIGAASNILIRSLTGHVTINAAVTSAVGHISVLAQSNVTQNADLRTGGGGTILVQAYTGRLTMAGTAALVSGGGTILARAFEQVHVGVAQAGTGTVAVTADASYSQLLDANGASANITGGEVSLWAGAIVGSLTDRVEVTASRFCAEPAALAHVQLAATNIPYGAIAPSWVQRVETNLMLTPVKVNSACPPPLYDWSSLGGLPGTSYDVYALARQPGAGITSIYAAGLFTVAGDVVAHGVAKWDGAKWVPLGTNSANKIIYALAVDPAGNVYVGGGFTNSFGVRANGIARWNGTNWSDMGSSTFTDSFIVHALAVDASNQVIVGGSFGYTLPGITNIARWNPATGVWSPLGGGLPSAVDALTVSGAGDLYAGGAFQFVSGGRSVYGVSRWTGTMWTNLGDGVGAGGRCLALASWGASTLYVGGIFTNYIDGTMNMNVARWTGTNWTVMVTNFKGSEVRALAVDASGRVYAGGFFTNIGSAAAAQVALWNGTNWSALGMGIREADNSPRVRALLVDGAGALYAGGAFDSAGGIAVSHIAKWNGAAWSALGRGINDSVVTIGLDSSGRPCVGGDFGGAALRVALWDGSAWTNLGAGMTASVWQVVGSGTGVVYAGTLNNVGLAEVHRWSNGTWTRLGDQFSGSIFDLKLSPSGDLYACGGFLNVGTAVVNRIARWDGQRWRDVGGGLGNQARAMAFDSQGRLYAGGDFFSAGGVSAIRVARFDGQSWTNLAGGLSNTVRCLAVDSGDHLYVGGDFTNAGGVAANYVAKWNGVAWTNLGVGLNQSAYRMIADEEGGLLVAGDFFTRAGEVPVHGFAYWNGSDWVAIGTRVGTPNLNPAYSSPPRAMVSDGAGSLYVVNTWYDGTNAMPRVARATRRGFQRLLALGTNGVRILNGDAASLAKGTDYGLRPAWSGSVDRTFSLTNASFDTLHISTVNVSGAHAADFQVVASPDVLNPRAMADLTVRFDPSDEGVRSAALSLVLQGDLPPLGFALAGEGYYTPDYRPGHLVVRDAEQIAPENNPLLLVRVERTNGSYGAVGVSYLTTNGNALAGSDYVGATGLLFFADAQTSAVIAVGVVDDSILEAEESFRVNLGPPQGGAKLGAQTSTVVRITDNDVPGVLSLVVTNLVVDEEAGSAVLRVERTVGAAGTVSVAYTTVVDTASAGGDYTTTHGTLTFGPEEFNASVPVPIVNDTAGESVERFTFRISHPTGGATLDSITQAVVEIQDDDRSIFLLSGRHPVSEGVAGGQISLEVRRSGDLSSTARVEYAVSPGTAQANLDYIPTAGALTFDVGSSNAFITVALVDDGIVGEPVETFTVHLSNPSEGFSLGGLAATVVEIQDNDRLLLSENFNTGYIPAGWRVKANRDPGNLWRFDNPGRRGNFTGGSGGMAIADSYYLGECFWCYAYRRMDTELISPAFDCSGMNTVTLRYRSHLAGGNSQPNLCDVDVSIQGTQGPWTTVLRRTSNLFGPPLEVMDLSSRLAGQPNAAIRFRYYEAAGSGWWQVDDVRVEGLAMNPASFGALTLDAGSAQVAEGARQYMVNVLRSGGAQGTVTATLSIQPLTATAGADYASPVSVPLTFYPGMQAISHRIAILDDALNEGSESFRVVLSAPGGGAGLGLVQTNVVTLLDDEGILADLQVAVEDLPAVIRQGSNLAVTVTAQNLGPSTASVAVVQYLLPPSAVLASTSLSRGLATNQAGLLRWTIGSLNPFEIASAGLAVRFAATGEVTNRFTVAGDEADGDPLNNAVAVTSQVRSAGVLQFATPVFSANERGGVLVVEVLRVGGSLGEAVVQVTSVEDSARAGFDFQAVNQVLAFAEGETVQSFSLPLLDDAVVEGTELLYLQLSGAVGAGLGSPWAAVSLQDDDILSLLGAEAFNAPPPAPSGLVGPPSAGAWRVVTNAGPVGWRFDDPGARGNQSGGAGGFAVADSAAAGQVPMDTELISPVYSFAGSLGAALEFKTDLVTTQGLGEVRVSTNGLGGPWAVVWDSRGQAWPGPRTVVVALGEAVASQTNVLIGFRYFNATNDGWWAVDEVNVYGEQDADSDLLPDWWEVLNFGGVGTQSSTNDYDRDGADNLHEFGADTSPTNELSNPEVVRLVWSNGTSRVSFVGSPNRWYDVEGAGQATGPWRVLESGVLGVGALQETSVEGGDTNSFYRLHIRGF